MNNTSTVKTNTTDRIKKLCGMALFCALAYISVLISPIRVQFLTFDFKDAVMGISAILYGPVSGLVMSLVTSVVEMVTVSSTGPWGMLMNFISSSVFVVSVSLIYKYKRNMVGAIMGLIVAVVMTTGTMVLANLFITPLYLGVARSDVVALLPKLLFPFNLIKSTLNASIVLLLYKPVITALRKAGFIKSDSNSKVMPKYKSVIIAIIAVLLIVACVTLFITVMGGNVSFGLGKK